MRESRCMSLLPRTTLHSDSEQERLTTKRIMTEHLKTKGIVTKGLKRQNVYKKKTEGIMRQNI
jgi:hypothetical protein